MTMHTTCFQDAGLRRRFLSRTALFAVLLLAASTARLAAQPDAYSAPELPWRTIETKHFTVSYHEGAERTARVVARIAEDIHGPITSLYNQVPSTKVHFVIKDISDYSNGAAYFFNNKIEIWASPLDFELRGTHNWLRNVIAHEYTHVIQMQAAMKWGRSMPALTLQWFGYESERRNDVLYGFPNTLVSYPIPGIVVPPWLAEGTAQYMRYQFGYENWDAHRDMILRSYVLADSMLTWGEMQAFGKTSLGNESVYNAGYNLTRYISRTYGEDAIVKITRAMSKPFIFTVDGAIRDVLGKSGADLYAEWKQSIAAEYAARIAPVLRARVEGDIVGEVGFANLHPVFSADGRTLYYTSNKTSDYFGRTAVYARDMETGKEELVVGGVRSAVSLSPDGRRLLYAKYNPPGVYGHLYYDLYVYDLASKSESRLTRDLRATSPTWSPDGARIAFVHAKDGTVNLATVDTLGGDMRALTTFTNGEQVFTPQWHPGGRSLVFGYSARVQRSIATINADGSDMRVLLSDPEFDHRDPRYSADGRTLYYAADRTGIFNIYAMELATMQRSQLTNVTGGAFMPVVNGEGTLAFARYTAGGYKLAVRRNAAPLALENNDYLPARSFAPAIASASTSDWEWERLAAYDDANLPDAKSVSYKTIFQNMMFFPTLRVDGYNPRNTGLALLKPGLMLYSSDILGRLEMLASGAININGERDLFLGFTYRDRVPLLANLGLFPDVNLEVYNVTRSTESVIEDFFVDPVGLDVDFNLLEFAARVRHNLGGAHTSLEAGYRHSRYTSTIGSYRNPDLDVLVPARDNLYLIGNGLSLDLKHHEIMPARDAEINPVGFRAHLRYDYEANRFNPQGDYEFDASTGMLLPRYTSFLFHRVEGQVFLSTRLPGGLHTASVRLRGGSILGAPVDDFFNFYAGGIMGMQGYTYYALGGNEVYSANVTYRFPILPSMGLRIGHLLFDKLYGGVFFDAGDAVMAPREASLAGMKKDVGFDLRLESFSFSMYPTRISFSGAYGLDSFTRQFSGQNVTYGREWRWYVSVLFGFDLSDGVRRFRR